MPVQHSIMQEVEASYSLMDVFSIVDHGGRFSSMDAIGPALADCSCNGARASEMVGLFQAANDWLALILIVAIHADAPMLIVVFVWFFLVAFAFSLCHLERNSVQAGLAMVAFWCDKVIAAWPEGTQVGNC